MAQSDQPLPLDSPRWAQLSTRMGFDGGQVREALRALLAGSAHASLFSKLWPDICSEGTTYDAAYAVAPYLVQLARQASASEAADYLIVLGLIETDADAVPADLESAYRHAVKAGTALVLDRLADCPADQTLRYLLAAVAALRGRSDLASVLQDLDAVSSECPTCGSTVFPDELQDVIRRDEHERIRP